MTAHLDFTHDPARKSHVESANEPGADFPIQNLPFGVFSRGDEFTPRVGVAIGDHIFDVGAALDGGLFEDELTVAAAACRPGVLNDLMSLGRASARGLRHRISGLLEASDTTLADAGLIDQVLIPMDSVQMHVPTRIGDYTDFYASVHHATNVGSMFRPDNPLLPNYKWIPVGYHGRASSIVVSGTDVVRPHGQTAVDGPPPVYEPTKRFDYELEVGFFVGKGNRRGRAVPIESADDHIFGLCLVNDWSARDIQPWEYQPLGPFLSKSFATSISPWVITLDALEPFRCPAFERPADDPKPLPHLHDAQDQARGGLDLQLTVSIISEKMRASGADEHVLSRGNFSQMYWTIAQMLTHHASNGCNLRPGDLMASGTVSGPEKSMRGCLLELTWRGSEPIELPSGEERRFLENGDELILRGRCEADGAVGIGFGECRGIVIPTIGG
jgi:fumarylacetoacetase